MNYYFYVISITFFHFYYIITFYYISITFLF